MIYLLIVSLIWAFSFGIIKNSLVDLNPFLVAAIRLLISFLVFIPFLNFSVLKNKYSTKLLGIGIIQYGFMYSSYIYAFQLLQSFEVALLTIFTPLYVVVISDLLKRKFSPVNFIAGFISVLGVALILFKSIPDNNLLIGIILVQISNISFAFGQVYYVKIMNQQNIQSDKSVFAILYLGGFLFSALIWIFSANSLVISFTSTQAAALIYLGIIASGLGFFLWNLGARKVNSGELAVFNNLKVPLAVFVSLIFFNESTDIIKLIIGGSLTLSALLISSKFQKI